MMVGKKHSAAGFHQLLQKVTTASSLPNKFIRFNGVVGSISSITKHFNTQRRVK
uniref:Uncharacterized protein n=1 Tax=Octopus bimaculoides TaxID=37653 RepID=A0A0L8H861_OCTBM